MSHSGEKKFVYFPGICFFDEVKNEDDKLQVPLSHFKTILFNVFPNIFLLANYHKENLLLLFSFCSSCFQTCSATSNLICTDSKMSHKLDVNLYT